MKAKIYQYFGLYLAKKEECEYIQSEEFWKKFKEITSDPECDMSFRDVQGLLIGLWQADLGYCRAISRYSLRRSKFLNIVAWFDSFFMNVKRDLLK